MPALSVDARFHQSLWLLPPFLSAVLAGRVGAAAQFTFGFDSKGLVEFARTGDPAHRAAMARGADFFADAAMRGDLSGDTLDAACFLDNERFAAAQRDAGQAGRNFAPARPLSKPRMPCGSYSVQ